MLNWTPEGMIGSLFRAMGPFAPPPPPGAQPPPLWGGEDHVRELFGDRVDLHTLDRHMLEITAVFRAGRLRKALPCLLRPHDRGGGNAKRDGREAEFDQAFRAFGEEWNLGSPDDARFEQEYLIAVGTRR